MAEDTMPKPLVQNARADEQRARRNDQAQFIKSLSKNIGKSVGEKTKEGGTKAKETVKETASTVTSSMIDQIPFFRQGVSIFQGLKSGIGNLVEASKITDESEEQDQTQEQGAVVEQQTDTQESLFTRIDQGLATMIPIMERQTDFLEGLLGVWDDSELRRMEQRQEQRALFERMNNNLEDIGEQEVTVSQDEEDNQGGGLLSRLMGGRGGKLTKMLSSAGGMMGLFKVLAKFTGIGTIAAALFDFFRGFMNAGEILGKEENISMVDRIAAGFGQLFESLASMLDWVLNLFGLDIIDTENLKENVAGFTKQLLDGLGDVIYQMIEEIDKAIDIIMNPFDLVEDIAASLFEKFSQIANFLGFDMPEISPDDEKADDGRTQTERETRRTRVEVLERAKGDRDALRDRVENIRSTTNLEQDQILSLLKDAEVENAGQLLQQQTEERENIENQETNTQANIQQNNMNQSTVNNSEENVVSGVSVHDDDFIKDRG